MRRDERNRCGGALTVLGGLAALCGCGDAALTELGVGYYWVADFGGR